MQTISEAFSSEAIHTKKIRNINSLVCLKVKTYHTYLFKGATARLVHFEKFSLNFTISSFVIHVDLRHP